MAEETGDKSYTGPEYLADYFSSLVNIVSKPIGAYLRQCVLNRLKIAIPGRAVMIAWHDYGRFRDLFFPKASPMEQASLDSLTGVSESAWGYNCAPFVCDTIYNVTKNKKNYINTSRVHSSEKSIVSLMNNNHAAFYRYLLKNYVNSENPTAAAYNKLTDAEKKNAKTDYINAITNDAWVSNKTIAYEKGEWPDSDWELYHHWNKIMILGATTEEVNGLINLLASKRLPIKETVNAGNWLTYARWVTQELGWYDFSEARDSMNYGTAVGGYYCDEIFSGLFMSSGNPGEPYWQQAPDVSCFNADTLIKTADGSLRSISFVKRGDSIATPRGPRQVMFVSTPCRGSRSLYSFDGHAFRFSGTHPFVTKKGYASMEPDTLCNSLPTFLRDNVEDFKAGTVLQTSCGHDSTVTGVKTHPCCDEHGREEILYDLIPEMDESGVFEYYAGDENAQYLVASEIPVVAGKEQEAYSFIKAFDIIVKPVMDILADIPNENLWEFVHRMLWHNVRHELIPKMAAIENSALPEQAGIQVDASLFSGYADFFKDSDTNLRIGLLFAAAFQELLPIFLNKRLSPDTAEIIGNILVEDIKSGIAAGRAP